MLEFPWPNGTTQKTNDFQRMIYMVGFNAAKDLLTDDLSSHSTGPTSVVPEIHGIRFSWMSNFANANQVGLLAGSGVAGSTITLYTAAFTTGVQQDVSARDTLSTWTRTDIKFLYLSQSRTGANVTSTGDAWVRFANIHVIGKRYSRYGVDQTESSGIEALKPYLIVEDLLGTVLNGKFDPGQIYTDNVLIDQASWWSATPVSDILAAANEWNGDAWWGVWAPANPDALPRLDYRYWNVSPRYTLDDTAQSLAAGRRGGMGELGARHVHARKRRADDDPRDGHGAGDPARVRLVRVGTLAINTRDLSLDLSDRGPMTRAKAVELAGQMLFASATDKASGSAVVTGPILDDSTGRIVQPWEIRPGWPILVGSTPNQFTSGTPLTYDGESTFRLTKVTYSAQDDTATLELDGGARHLFKGAGVRTPLGTGGAILASGVGETADVYPSGVCVSATAGLDPFDDDAIALITPDLDGVPIVDVDPAEAAAGDPDNNAHLAGLAGQVARLHGYGHELESAPRLALPTAAVAPRIAGFVTRQEWGAVPPTQVSHNVWPQQGGTAVHYGGAPARVASHTDCLRRVKAWQAYHMGVHGWSDIAYNLLVCDHGYVFAGRGLGVRSAAQGTDEGNNDYVAVCHVNGTATPATPALEAAAWCVVTFRKAGAGLRARPHRTFHSTDCPGNSLATYAVKWWDGKAIAAGGTAPPVDPTAARVRMVQAVQRAIHVDDDGHWGAITDAAVNAVRDGLDAKFASPAATKAAQRAVGVSQDGIWGKASKSAENWAVRLLQVGFRYADHDLGSDGVWGPLTNTAYVACRRAAFGK
jgi:hypothetical protein